MSFTPASDTATTANRWSAQRYNATNAWIFNGNSGSLTNNNVTNRRRSQAVTNLPKDHQHAST